MLKKIWTFLHSNDLITWLGHGVMGFGLDLIAGPVFVMGAFVYREVSDLINWWADPESTKPTPLDSVLGLYPKRPFKVKLKDGFFDLWSPLAGAALAEILKGVL